MLSVFYAILPNEKIEKTGIIERDKEIFEASNEKVKRQKYFAWKLLLKGLTTLNFNTEDLDFAKSSTGKWTSSKVEFSISHCENLVVVAISDTPVGVDVERLKAIDVKLSNRILNDSEMQEFVKLDDSDKQSYLIKKWTQKESVFKCKNLSVLRYKELQLDENTLTSKKLEIDDKTYFLTVCHSKDLIANFEYISL